MMSDPLTLLQTRANLFCNTAFLKRLIFNGLGLRLLFVSRRAGVGTTIATELEFVKQKARGHLTNNVSSAIL